MQTQQHVYRAVANGAEVQLVNVPVGTSHADAWTAVNAAFDAARATAKGAA